MDIQTLSAFVEKRIEMLPTRFTLMGNSIAAQDIASPKGMLPLVALYIKDLNDKIEGKLSTNAPVVEPADPKTHLLSSAVYSLPDIPEGLLNLLTNSAILTMAREPVPELDLPRDLSEASLPETSELLPHISKFSELVISPLVNPSKETEQSLSR